jgi:cytochrome c553
LERVWNRIRVWVSAYSSPPVTVFYDKHSEPTRRLVNLLTVLDIFHRLSFVQSPRTASTAERQNNKRELSIATASGPCHGRDAMKLLARPIPLLWPFLPFCYVWKAVQSSK